MEHLPKTNLPIMFDGYTTGTRTVPVFFFEDEHMTTLKHRLQLFALLMLLPTLAQAATSVGLSTIMKTFQTVTQGWYTSIFTDALGLFAALFGIEIVWMVVKWLITGKDVHEIFSSFIKKLITIGFFYGVLITASQWVPYLIGGFKNVAVESGGAPITTVSDLAMTGIRGFVLCVEGGPISTLHSAGNALTDLWNLNLSGAAASLGNAADSAITTALGVNTLAGIIVGFVLLLSFTYVVLELVAIQLEGMIVLSAGVIMLGFGGSSFTAKFVESYMQFALNIGVRLMVVTLWASFIEWQVNPLIKQTLIAGHAGFEAYAIVMILALLIAWLTKKLPNFAASILSGQSTLSGGEMYKAVKDATIAAGAVVATAGVGAAALAGGAAAGGMGAAAGGAGSAGAGSMGAASGAGGATGGAAATVPAPVSGSGAAAPKSGVVPKMDSTASQPSSPSAQPSGGNTGQKTASQPSGEQRTETPKAQDESQPDSSVQSGESTSGTDTPVKGATPVQSGSKGVSPVQGGASPKAPAAAPKSSGTTDSVDHRPAAPNEAPQSGSSGGSTVPAPSLLDNTKKIFNETHKGLHKAHDAISPGESSGASVSAPSLGVKHLSD